MNNDHDCNYGSILIILFSLGLVKTVAPHKNSCCLPNIMAFNPILCGHVMYCKYYHVHLRQPEIWNSFFPRWCIADIMNHPLLGPGLILMLSILLSVFLKDPDVMQLTLLSLAIGVISPLFANFSFDPGMHGLFPYQVGED